MNEDTNSDAFLEMLLPYVEEKGLIEKLCNLKNLAAVKLATFLDGVHKSIISFFLNHC